MIREELLNNISDVNFWGRQQDTGIARPDCIETLETVLGAKGMVSAVIGVRRAGKTTVAKQLLSKSIADGRLRNEQTLYVSFDEPQFQPHLGSPDILQDIYESYRYRLNKNDLAVIVLDEVHNVEGWENWVRMMLERKENVKMLVSGSSAKLLGRELASKLTGRTLTTTVFPLGFGEFLRFREDAGGECRLPTTYNSRTRALFREYLEFGGFPLVVLNEREDIKRMILRELFNGITTRDIVERYDVRPAGTLKSLAALSLHSCSSYVSVPKLVNIYRNATRRAISPTTVNRYLEYCSEAFLLFQVPIFRPKLKEQMLLPKKLYCIDNGLVNAATFKLSENLGPLAENMVFVELLRRQAADPDLQIFYWKNGGGEVDFVLKRGPKVEGLLQVCWSLKDNDTKAREVKALMEGMDDFKLKTGIILNEDQEVNETVGGKKIRVIPLWRFLLDSAKYLKTP
jgi:predicted AAA+ superfamily ATPase